MALVLHPGGFRY